MSGIDTVVRINGVEIPGHQRGRKVKLHTLMTSAQITAVLLLGKKAGEQIARKRKTESMGRENKAENR